MPNDRYIPNPYDGPYSPYLPPCTGLRGNPHPVDTPAWRAWNEGYHVGMKDAAISVMRTVESAW